MPPSPNRIRYGIFFKILRVLLTFNLRRVNFPLNKSDTCAWRSKTKFGMLCEYSELDWFHGQLSPKGSQPQKKEINDFPPPLFCF